MRSLGLGLLSFTLSFCSKFDIPSSLSLFQLLEPGWTFGTGFTFSIDFSNIFVLIGLGSLNLNNYINVQPLIPYHYRSIVWKAYINSLNEVHTLSFSTLPLIDYSSEEWTLSKLWNELSLTWLIISESIMLLSKYHSIPKFSLKLLTGISLS